MRKRIRISVLLVSILLLTGCQGHGSSSGQKDYIYCINSNGKGVEKIEYQFSENILEVCTVAEQEKEAKAILEELSQQPARKEWNQAIPKEVKVLDQKVVGDRIDVTLNEQYYFLPTPDQMLLRACIVKSLVIIPKISKVQFFIGDKPMKDMAGEKVGILKNSDFVSGGKDDLQRHKEEEFLLYYTNETGDKLEAERRKVSYNSNISVEKQIVEELIKKPTKKSRYQVLPSEVTVINVSIKDDICYVNLDYNFLSMIANIQPEIPIYAITHSIIANTDAEKVQIMVYGKKDLMFQNIINLDKPFEWNEKLMDR